MENLTRITTFSDYVGELTAIYRRTSVPTTKITCSKDAETFIRPYFDVCMDNHEELKIIHLNNNNQIVNVHELSKGGTAGTIVDIKLILQQAILIKTRGIIMIHNHPSSSLKPSKADLDISKKLSKACELLDLMLLDSIIITRESYLSMKDEALF